MTRSQTLIRPDLDIFVDAVDTAFVGRDEGNILLRLTGERPSVGMLRIGQRHPLDELLGYDAPQSWSALGMHCAGVAQRLGDVMNVHSGDYTLASGDDPEPVDVRFTMLVDRDGRGSGVLRSGHRTTRLAGAPEGLLGDACRRALGLFTTGPPPTTTGLWSRIWLQCLVDGAYEDPDRWEWDFADVVNLHPAVLGAAAIVPSGAPRPASPEELVEATLELAMEWPWPRLRRSPWLVSNDECPPPSSRLFRWMDDGMFARWVLADHPPMAVQLQTLRQDWVPRSTVYAVEDTLQACGLTVSGASL